VAALRGSVQVEVHTIVLASVLLQAVDASAGEMGIDV
jgi:hypothetical protein